MKRTNFFLFILIFLFCDPVSEAQQKTEPSSSICIPCEALMNLNLPDVKIISAEPRDNTVKFCRVMGIIGEEIKFELILPDMWNERFIMGGGGGFVGSIANSQRWRGRQGYATVGTDTGHEGSNLDGTWALNNIERQVNFGFLAVHRTAAVAKSLISLYYGRSPLYSYFAGCSRGGGQALMEAQRYPDDFDGIICEGPGFDWAGIALECIDNYKSQFPKGYTKEEGILSFKNVELLEKIMFDRYDMVDGIKDGIINNPIDIIPDYTFLPKCPDGKPSDGCFTDEQINVIRTFYEGVSVKGQKIYPGFPVGRESGWYMPSLINDTGAIKLGARTWFGAFGSQIFKYLVFNDPEWDLYSYDFSNYSDDTEFAASFLSSISTDYTRYKARGGKMIIIHGLTDYSATPIRTIEYYNSVREADKDINDYIRLYLVPGMNHCVPGIGPSQVDWLKVLSDWVENEKAPERVVVSKYEKNELLMTRPLYPYPQIAVYDGKGDPNKESSFKSSAEK